MVNMEVIFSKLYNEKVDFDIIRKIMDSRFYSGLVANYRINVFYVGTDFVINNHGVFTKKSHVLSNIPSGNYCIFDKNKKLYFPASVTKKFSVNEIINRFNFLSHIDQYDGLNLNKNNFAKNEISFSELERDCDNFSGSIVPKGEFIELLYNNSDHNVVRLNHLIECLINIDPTLSAMSFNGFIYHSDFDRPHDKQRFVSIAKVIDVGNNGRLAVIIGQSPQRFSLIICYPDDMLYDYLDKQRVLLVSKKKGTVSKVIGILGNDISPRNISDHDIEEEKLVKYIKNNTDNPVFINEKTLLKFLNPSEIMRKRKLKVYDKLMSKLDSWKIDQSEEISINGLVAKKGFFKYDSVAISSKNDEISKNIISTSLLRSVNQLKSEYLYASTKDFDISRNFNFNTIFTIFVNLLESYIENWRYRTATNVGFSIGDIDLYIEKHQNSRYTINGIRVNRNEIARCIERAICYQSRSDYENFLSIVSKCSLELHKLIDGGITFNFVTSAEYSEPVRLSITRQRGKNFLKLGNDGRIKVKNIRNFAKRCNGKTIGLASLGDIFNENYFDEKEMNSEVVVQLIQEGKERSRRIHQKSQEILESTVKTLNGTIHETYKCGDFSLRNAVEIRGKSGNTYIISNESNTDSCDAYIKEGDSLKYICMIDRNLGNSKSKDKIVNRLFALANDSKLTNEISSLRSVVS